MERNSFAVHVSSIAEGVDICNRLAAEHLELHLHDTDSVVPQLNHYGALFIGDTAAEVLPAPALSQTCQLLHFSKASCVL